MLAGIVLATMCCVDVLGAEARVFELPIRDQRLDVPDRTIRVTHRDRVELRWSSDHPLSLHLHGYDLEVEAGPERPATMRFEADITGRFQVARRTRSGGDGHDEAVLYLEVHPD